MSQKNNNKFTGYDFVKESAGIEEYTLVKNNLRVRNILKKAREVYYERQRTVKTNELNIFFFVTSQAIYFTPLIFLVISGLDVDSDVVLYPNFDNFFAIWNPIKPVPPAIRTFCFNIVFYKFFF